MRKGTGHRSLHLGGRRIYRLIALVSRFPGRFGKERVFQGIDDDSRLGRERP
jgi:hypothetical protein